MTSILAAAGPWLADGPFKRVEVDVEPDRHLALGPDGAHRVLMRRDSPLLLVQLGAFLATVSMSACTGSTGNARPSVGSSAPSERSAPTTTETASITSSVALSTALPPCTGVQVEGMRMYRNGLAGDHRTWGMVAEVVIQNFRGPACDLSAYPGVALSRGIVKEDEYPTRQTRIDEGPNAVVRLGWNPDGPEDGPLAHFLVYTTQATADGAVCPEDRLTKPLQMNVSITGIGKFPVSAGPDEGPAISTCEGRIGVTAITQKQ